MAKRSAVEQIVIEEKTVGDAIHKLVSSREKVSAWHLKWAKFEEDEYLIFLFSKLAELRWIWNESLKQFSEKHLDYTKTFKEIHHEERVIEDAKKALQSCESKMIKIRKQIESAQKKGDSVKVHTLDKEMESQIRMIEHLQKKIDSHTDNLLRFKIDQIHKGLTVQAQSGLILADQMRHLFIAQLRIAELVSNSAMTDTSVTWQMINHQLIGLSDTLGMYPPPAGAVDPLPSPSEFSQQGRRSVVDSPGHSPSNSTSSNMAGRSRSFPFPFRPLPHEPPVDTDRSSSPTQISPLHGTLNHTPISLLSKNTCKFVRTSSDVTPQSVNAVTIPYKQHKTGATIFEESHDDRAFRSKSLSQPSSREHFMSLQRNMTNMSLGEDLPQNRSRSQNQCDTYSVSSQDDLSNKSSRVPSDVENQGGPDSEPGYADPIDALKKYYESQNQTPSDTSSLDIPYQSLNEIQRIRQAQMTKVHTPDEDPTYSRPYDCLIGLPAPVKVRGEVTTKRFISPLALQRRSTPDFPVSLADRHANKRRSRTSRKHPQRTSRSSSEENLSSSLSPSPEPDFHLLQRNQSSGSVDLLQEEDPAIILAEDHRELLKSRISSDGDLLSITSQETQSSSPQPSPIHVPSPVELTRMQNGFAQLIYPDLSTSQ